MKKLSLKELKLGTQDLLRKEQLRTVFGGYGNAPNNPTGSGSQGRYKCCWKNDPSNCSACVSCTASCTCVSGAKLTVC